MCSKCECLHISHSSAYSVWVVHIYHDLLFFIVGLIGLAISYALAVTGLLSAVVNAFTETEKEMIAVERVCQYIDQIELENSREIIAPPYAWPSQGVVTFTDVVLRYR